MYLGYSITAAAILTLLIMFVYKNKDKIFNIKAKKEDEPDDIEVKLKIDSALQRIKKSEKANGFHDRPVFLILGKEGSGRSSLLANSGVTYIKKSVGMDHVFEFYVSSNEVFIEPKLEFFVDKKELYHYFISAIIKRAKIRSIIVTLSIDELAGHSVEKNGILELLQHCVFSHNKYFHKPMYYLLLTKFDKAIGFSEYFSDIASSQTDLVCGIDFTKCRESFASFWEKQFASLCNSSKYKVLKKFKLSGDLESKKLSLEFSRQLEAIGQYIPNILRKLFSYNGYKNKFAGVFFTSSGGLNDSDGLANTVIDTINKRYDLSAFALKSYLLLAYVPTIER